MRTLKAVLLVLVMLWPAVGCASQLSSTPTPNWAVTRIIPSPTPTFPAPGEWSLIASPVGSLAVPAGSSIMFGFEFGPYYGTDLDTFWNVENLPDDAKTEFISYIDSWHRRLIVTLPQSMLPGDYTAAMSIYQSGDSQQSGPLASVPFSFTVTPCIEAKSGFFSHSIKAGETRIMQMTHFNGSGLIVPVQICHAAHLRVVITHLISETGVELTSPWPFKLFRSLVYPAPSEIFTGGGSYYPLRNVNEEWFDGKGWQLETDVAPGLYLLVFYNRGTGICGSTEGACPPPESKPDFVAYDLQIGP